jgi:hypothetical protein
MEKSRFYDDLGNIAYIFFCAEHRLSKCTNTHISNMPGIYAGLGSEIVEQKLRGPVGSSVRHPHPICIPKTRLKNLSKKNFIFIKNH